MFLGEDPRTKYFYNLEKSRIKNLGNLRGLHHVLPLATVYPNHNKYTVYATYLVC